MQRLLPGRHVRVFPPDRVTSRNPAEVEPRAAGMRAEDVDEIWRAVTTLYKTGLHPAIALCVRRHGRIVLDRAIGHLRVRYLAYGELEKNREAMMRFGSGTKPLEAIARTL